MINDKYNYSLNGIEHEIILNDHLKIDKKPLNQIVLVSNKYLLKYIHDIFNIHNIQYILTGDALLGAYIFKGINIFNCKLELCTSDIHFFKLKKLENEIKNDGFDIVIHDDKIKISTVFFEKYKCVVYIYPIMNDNQFLKYNINKKIIYHDFYDIYPIKNIIFEEYEICVPNKIEKVLELFGFNMNYISFSNKINDKIKIIDEVEEKSSINILRDNFNNFISIIKPFIFNDYS
jgi:hypothetical protein